MRRRVLLYLTLIAVSACNGDKVVQPNVTPASPTDAISDATHASALLASNPEFFFLPPLVSNPSASSYWDAGAFNPNLTASVEICDLAATTEDQVKAGATCVANSTVAYPATVSAADEHYQVNWKVPTSGTIFYRITVKVGAKPLGFADVETGANTGQLKKVATAEFIPLQDGRTLPIKFRVERFALCEHPDDHGKPCVSTTVDLSTGGTVSTNLAGSDEPTGITIPSQGPNAPSAIVTVQGCDDMNPRAIDLPTFGPCIRVTADDGTSASATGFTFTNAATVFTCDVDAAVHAAIAAGRLTAAQEPLVTLHRLDGFGTSNQRVAALQHVPACGKGLSSRGGSLAGMLASLAHGQFKRAARQAASLLAPEPLYASMFIDLGGGGFTEALSDFQFALPAKMSAVEGTDGLSVAEGTTLDPAVRVTDLHGDPVFGATVQFASGVKVTTGSPGTATAQWTIVAGTNRFSATGRGIASLSSNGPRDGVDPFQPIHDHIGFDPDIPDGPEVPVGTGIVSFSVGGFQNMLADGFENEGDLGSATGFWHRASLKAVTGAPLSNVAFPSLVAAPSGEQPGGLLTGPFTGARALWFGSDAHGNYAGPLGNATQTGGTSAEARSGVATSPELLIPDMGTTTLSFRSWFEIESVNPSAFDSMVVAIQEVGDGPATTIAHLNPTADPGGSPTIPFTSGGFNQPPVWKVITADLSAYHGKRVRLAFRFNTRDVLYNGFRGWVVDDVTVRSVPATGLASSTILIPLRATLSETSSGAPDPAPRTWHP